MKVYALNERTLILEFGTRISAELSRRVLAVNRRLRETPLPGVLDIWPTYGSLAVQFDAMTIDQEELKSHLAALADSTATLETSPPKEVVIPTRYDTDAAEDMRSLSESLQLPPSDIVRLHSQSDYTVAMIGFLPGFPYLIGLPDELHHPRKGAPSLRIQAGSVGIGGSQTGIYPNAGPGGWYIIGTTDVPLFAAPDRFLLSPGDRVRFQPI